MSAIALSYKDLITESSLSMLWASFDFPPVCAAFPHKKALPDGILHNEGNTFVVFIAASHSPLLVKPGWAALVLPGTCTFSHSHSTCWWASLQICSCLWNCPLLCFSEEKPKGSLEFRCLSVVLTCCSVLSAKAYNEKVGSHAPALTFVSCPPTGLLTHAPDTGLGLLGDRHLVNSFLFLLYSPGLSFECFYAAVVRIVHSEIYFDILQNLCKHLK